MVKVIASDGNGGSVSETFDIEVSAANSAPTVGTTIPDQTAVVGLSFSYTFPSTSFSDADGDDLTYTATKPDNTALPGWLTFTNSSSTPRNFAGTPKTADIGTLSVKVTASDGTASVSDTFDIVVSADTAPAFAENATIADQTWMVDTQITAVTLPAAMGGNGTVSYELMPTLPTGVSFDTATRVVSGTPTVAAAQATYTWRAKDSDSNTANTDTAALTFELTVNKATLAKPTGLAVKANTLTTTGFTVTWDAVANAAGYTATAALGDATVTGAVSTSGTKPEAVFTGLEMNTTYTVTVVATGDANYANGPASEGLSVTTETAPGLVVSPTSLTVNEGATGTYMVKLATQPTDSVMVAVAGSGDVTVSPASLTFTTTNWDTTQTVTVSAAEDDDAVTDTAVTLTHRASGGDYASLPSERAPSVTVTITENDTRGVTVSPTSLTVAEGSSGTYTVVLDTQPTGNVTVTIGGASGDVSVSTTSLTFTSSTWKTAQTVTVTAATDADAANDAVVTLTHAVSGADYASETAPSVVVTITENDAATFSVTGPTSIAEDAGNATYTVSLSAQPGDDVTVKYATSDGTATAGSDYTAANGTLTFTTDNWDTAQTVEVAITDDTVDDDDETFTFTLSEAGTGSMLSASPTVTTTITDNDVPTVTVSFGAGTYSVTEGGTVNVAVTLSADPERSVSIPLTTTNGSGAVAGDYSGVPASVAFASGETSKTVIFSATDDSVDESDETVTLGFGASLPARVTAGTTAETVVTITDNDTVGLTYSAAPSTLTVGTPITALTATATGFGGATVTYSVTAGTLPAGLGISASTGEITGMPTTANASEVTVTVSATSGSGDTAKTATVNITFPAVGKATLATPTGLVLKANTQRKTGFTVSWTAVTNATGYTATATPSGGTAVNGSVDTTGTNPEAAFTGLTAGTTYAVSVVATGDTANYEANYQYSRDAESGDIGERGTEHHGHHQQDGDLRDGFVGGCGCYGHQPGGHAAISGIVQ